MAIQHNLEAIGKAAANPPPAARPARSDEQDNTRMRTFMIGNRMRAVALSAAFTLLSFAAPVNAAPFDGNWNMVLVTTNGHCGTIKIGMAVNGGHISATSGKS